MYIYDEIYDLFADVASYENMFFCKKETVKNKSSNDYLKKINLIELKKGDLVLSSHSRGIFRVLSVSEKNINVEIIYNDRLEKIRKVKSNFEPESLLIINQEKFNLIFQIYMEQYSLRMEALRKETIKQIAKIRE